MQHQQFISHTGNYNIVDTISGGIFASEIDAEYVEKWTNSSSRWLEQLEQEHYRQTGETVELEYVWIGPEIEQNLQH